MTKKEKLIEALKDILKRQGKGWSDKENDHSIADSALLNYIDDPDVTELFDNIDKWYA